MAEAQHVKSTPLPKKGKCLCPVGLAVNLQVEGSNSVIQMPSIENPIDFAPWHHAREFLREVSACAIEILLIAQPEARPREWKLRDIDGQAFIHSAYLRGAAKHLVIGLLDLSETKVKPSYMISNWFGPAFIEMQCYKSKKVLCASFCSRVS